MPRPMALLLATTIALVVATASLAADAMLPLLVEEDFEHGADRWAPTDAKAWKITQTDGGKVGLGSFDNTGQWDDFKLQGVKVEKK